MNEADIIELKRQLKSEHEADLAAIQRVTRLLRERKIGAQRPADSQPQFAAIAASGTVQNHDSVNAFCENENVKTVLNGHGSIEQSIEKAINQSNGPFTLSQLISWVGGSVKRSTVSGVLFRGKDRIVRVVEPGRGRRPAIYQKIAS